jgi:predicted GNAT superfamily acetyltransferase
MAEITIRPLKNLNDLRGVVELQRVYWGSDAESVIPAHMLFSIARHGGHVLTAFDGDRMIGVLVGFIGTADAVENPRPAMANLQIVSKRMVVLPEYRGSGVGYRLKLAQRDLAIAQGIRLVEWTFDPLLSLNAHLNVRKLGVICSHYLRDYYGTEAAGGLAVLGSSDRLVAEWWVTNRRVEERVTGDRPPLAMQQYLDANALIVNPTRMTSDGMMLPAEQDAVPDTDGRIMVMLEVPLNFPDLASDNAALATRWRLHTRALLPALFGRGFVVTDFVRGKYENRERAMYVLSYNGPQSDASLLN